MLVLSRKKGESIVVGNGLFELVVVEIRGGKVRLGISAPRELPVHRGEAQAAIDRKRKATSEDGATAQP